jgi:hypothetical protein
VTGLRSATRWLLAAALSGPCGAAALAEAPWDLVAGSHLIVVGTPAVPARELLEAMKARSREHIRVPVRIERCLKGRSCPAATVVHVHPSKSEFDVDPADLIALHGKRAVLCLYLLEQEGKVVPYFAGHTPRALQPHSELLERRIDAEVKFQASALRHYDRLFGEKSDPAHTQVSGLIEAMLVPREARLAYHRIGALGEKAVPTLVRHIRDRRVLPVQDVSFVNPPGSFEGIRHYRAEHVGDFVLQVLNHITGRSFGRGVGDKAGERELDGTVDAWKIYVYHTRQREARKGK